mgnify:CR=1 FL=1
MCDTPVVRLVPAGRRGLSWSRSHVRSEAAGEGDPREERTWAISSLEHELGLLLGAPWDEEREVFRVAGDGSAVRWLHQVVS